MSTSTIETVTGALQEYASTAVEQIESLPERVAELTGKKGNSSQTRWLLLAAAALLALLGAGWWMRGRRQGQPAVDAGIDDDRNPVRSHSDRAVAAATGN
jgi:hypothetical protein